MTPMAKSDLAAWIASDLVWLALFVRALRRGRR